MTYREYIEKKYPDFVNPSFIGGIKDCPGDYVKGAKDCYECNCGIYKCDKLCPTCFNSEIPHDAVDAKTGKRVYPYKVKIKRKVKSK